MKTANETFVSAVTATYSDDDFLGSFRGSIVICSVFEVVANIYTVALVELSK